MAQNSKIEWTHHTANLWWGCTHVHEGCFNCYAETWAKRWGLKVWGKDMPRKAIDSVWSQVKMFQRKAEKVGEMHRVFVSSMMDIFEKPMPLIDSRGYKIKNLTTGDLRARFFEEVIPNSPNLLFLLLTKRPSNINKYIPAEWKRNPPKNVMYGTSPVNQETSKNLITHLLAVKGKRFLSVEPQLAEITLMPWLQKKQIHWVIQGGESGPKRRPFDTDWARKLKAECKLTNTPYFFKQIDKVKEIPKDLMIRNFPK